MPDFIAYLALGGGLGLGASLQPGPFQAFLLSRTLMSGWRRTLPVCLAPLLSDLPVALLALLVLGQLGGTAQHVLRTGGGLLLVYLAVRGVRAPGTRPAEPPGGATPRSIVEAALVNLLNPNPYIAWALVLGPALVSAWSRGPGHAAAFVVSFYAVMFAANAVFVLLVGTAHFLDARWQRRLVVASALLLGVLGAILLALGVHGLWRMR